MKDEKRIGVWTIIVGASIIIGIITGGSYFIEDRIEKKVLDKLKDQDILRQIASLVRPSIIFDHHGVKKSDSGADQYIESINVEMGDGEPNKIIISFKQHLNSTPILECINDNFFVTPTRMKKSDWLFELSSPSYIVFESSPERKEWLFRLEIIR